MFARLAVLALAAMSAGQTALANPTPRSDRALRPTRTRSAQASKRSDIDHDAVVGFDTSVDSGTAGVLMEKWWPYLYVVDGCVPFPAVDADGNTSGGLAPTGDSSGDCSSSTGQIYTRSESYGDYYAIMYSWYMPKDEPNLIEGALGIGHRYDWENVVVVLSGEDEDATLVGIAASYHGDYVACSGSDCDDYLDGTNPLIKYYTAYAILDHSLGFTTTVGGTQPLIGWNELTDAARDGLTDKDWGDATVSFLDSDFESYLAEAYEYLDL